MSLREKVFVVLALTVFALSAWALGFYLLTPGLNNWLTLEQIRDRLTADLPKGTPLSEIDKYLSSNEVSHGYREQDNEVGAMIPYI